MSSFDGVISELPCIRVDNFEVYKYKPQEIKAYFLSHYHTDHLVGLFDLDFLECLMSTKSNVYCTELTAAFIDNDLNDKSLMKFVKPLKMGTSILTLCLCNTIVYLTVTLIPAGHCAGSTMYLFRTIDKTVLYTGDFRINMSDLHNYKSLHFNDKPIGLDALYIDTTFLDKKYNNFPNRSKSVEEMLVVLIDWLKTENNMVAIRTSARYGYEYVFNEIFKTLGIKVYVDTVKWKVYSRIHHLVPGVTNIEQNPKIHLCKNNCQLHSDKNKNVLFIKLSAMKWSNYDLSSNKYCSDLETLDEHSTFLSVCFATHCSAQELLHFIKYFPPCRVVGFPIPITHLALPPGKVIEKDRKVDATLLRTLLD